MLHHFNIADDVAGTATEIAISTVIPQRQIRLVAVSALVENPDVATRQVVLNIKRTGQNPIVIAGPTIPASSTCRVTFGGGGTVRETGVADQSSMCPLPVLWDDDQWQAGLGMSEGTAFNITEGAALFESRSRFKAGIRKDTD